MDHLILMSCLERKLFETSVRISSHSLSLAGRCYYLYSKSPDMVGQIMIAKNGRSLLVAICITFISLQNFAQESAGWQLEQMPDSLEFQYALSSLPPHLRENATVYLLDPKKGYYVARKGTNGFCAYVNRTEWERGEFVQDIYAPLGFDSLGSKTLLPIFLEVGNMRASGKYSPQQLQDIVVQRVKDGTYKAPPRAGICYMLSPLFRTRTDQGIVSIVMPHYMIYAPFTEDSDIGGGWVTGGHQPFVASTGPVLDKAHSIFNYIIIAAGETEKAKIIEENKDLLEKLGAYKSFLKAETSTAEHHHNN
ncbi:MAG: hypothetical protein C5B59_19710 [Bacteroidetes bacterium]|nr:MAG: hypothetical protein C5B59_19710 [Bacteroidota bacterium]